MTYGFVRILIGYDVVIVNPQLENNT